MAQTNASPHDIATQVLSNIGGRKNVIANSLCMTRLRLRLANLDLVNSTALGEVPGVLGLTTRGSDGIEVVFGPKLVSDVYDAFTTLTLLDPVGEVVEGTSPMRSPLHVQITPPHEPLPSVQPSDPEQAMRDDLAGLAALMEDDSTVETDEPEPNRRRLLVINGPNINMLGIREPGTYGSKGYDELLSLCRTAAKEAGFAECLCFQSNHEGDIVDRIQDAYCTFDGIVINPGAYTHTSIAILDALKAVSIPTIEVHISKVEEREDFRQISYLRAACFETITGEGIEGYRHAINDMAAHLGI